MLQQSCLQVFPFGKYYQGRGRMRDYYTYTCARAIRISPKGIYSYYRAGGACMPLGLRPSPCCSVAARLLKCFCILFGGASPAPHPAFGLTPSAQSPQGSYSSRQASKNLSFLSLNPKRFGFLSQKEMRAKPSPQPLG